MAVGVTDHPNFKRLIEAIRAIRFGRIVEVQVQDGVPIRFRVEQLVDLSREETVVELSPEDRPLLTSSS